MMRDAKGLKGVKKHTVHDVADYNDRQAESIKNLTGLALTCASLKNGRSI